MVRTFKSAHIGVWDEKRSVFKNGQFIFWKKNLQKNFFQKHKIDFGGENKISLEK